MGHKTLNDLAEELQSALIEVGIADARVVTTDDERLVVMVDGASLPVTVLARSDFRPVHASELPVLARLEAGMVFADRIAQRTRETLRERGWGWFDRRRGHLRLWQPGLRVDASIRPRIAPGSGTRTRNPFTPAGRQLALWMLVHPDEPASPREIARQIDISPGQVSNLLAAFQAHALLRRDRRPLTPELFWALVEQWRPTRYPLLSWPPPDGLTAPELRSKEWVLTDAVAGVAAGVPLVVGEDYPPDFYVPDDKVLGWMLNRSTIAPDYDQRAATLAVAPTSLVCDERLLGPSPSGGLAGWVGSVAHPVVVALDLATDRSRGREAVSQWTPDPSLGVSRVW